SDHRLRWRPLSHTSTLRRARPRTSAALRPAGPPPIMIASYISELEVCLLETPAGTFIARVKNGAIQMPPMLLAWCRAEGWTLFHFRVATEDQLIMMPVLPEDSTLEFQASLTPEGMLWIPANIRGMIDLHEQSVMLRIEG